MLSRPSSRRKSQPEELNINLVPILDAMVTLIAFLLFSGAFLAISVIDTPAPLLADPKDIVEKLNKPPLNLTLRIQAEQIFIEGGFGNTVNRKISNLPDGTYDINGLHSALVEIKNRFPKETKIILMPEKGVSYDSLILIIDASRNYEKTDPTLFIKNPQTGIDESETKLFPEAIFGNLMS